MKGLFRMLEKSEQELLNALNKKEPSKADKMRELTRQARAEQVKYKVKREEQK